MKDEIGERKVQPNFSCVFDEEVQEMIEDLREDRPARSRRPFKVDVIVSAIESSHKRRIPAKWSDGKFVSSKVNAARGA